jgi:hypothetical protein
MRKYNRKQLGLIAGSLVVAFVINWALWWLFMKHPDEISFIYHTLLTVCIATALILIGDRILKTEIYR